MVRKDNAGPHRRLLGIVIRVGYYSKQDGTNVTWLVYPDGDYAETIRHSYLNRYFNVIALAEETDLFGIDRDVIEPLSPEEIAPFS